MVNLTEEQKQKISEMSSPSQMESNERKRQYSALRRAIRASGNPALTNKFEAANDAERSGPTNKISFHPMRNFIKIHFFSISSCSHVSDPGRFGMLKTWLTTTSLDSIDVEECYNHTVSDERKDRYVTMSLLQLEQKYGDSEAAQAFIKDITAGEIQTKKY